MRPIRELVVYFVLVYLITWGLAALISFAPEVARLFGEPSTRNPLFFVAVYVPSVVGLVLTGVYEGRDGLRRILGRLDPRRAPLWLIGLLVGFPALLYLTERARGLDPQFVGLAQAAAILAPRVLLDPGPIGEEIGWRGFALPRLLERFSPFAASVALGTIWGLWHLPVLIDPHYPQYGTGVTTFVIGTIAMSLFMTGAHLWTGGSILVAMLIHFLINNGGEVVGASFGTSKVAWYLLAAGAVVIGFRRFFSGPPRPPGAGAEPVSPARGGSAGS